MTFYDLEIASISNRHLRLDYLVQAGPRLVRLVMANSDTNLLGETPQLGWETPFGHYHLYGGHRLWHAPENFPLSSIPDDTGLQIIDQVAAHTSVRLVGALEKPTGLRKEMLVTLDEDRPALHILHTTSNEGDKPVQISPWAITVLPAGGVAVAGQKCSLNGSHGPDRQVVFWPDTSPGDPRFHFLDAALVIEATTGLPPSKIGVHTHQGWLVYQWQEYVFIKRFEPVQGAPYPDLGCNAEIFCGPSYIELETLAPLQTIQPGQSASHAETWEIHPAPPGALNLKQIASQLSHIAETSSSLAFP
ncbi:MAG TPA: hypothetical protein PKM21_00660 [Anaerolineales bacterium]|nr:hypothetical protein [Anaerolineales bacterium]